MLPLRFVGRHLLAVIALSAALVSPLAAAEKSGRKPNVVVIVADDLGYADLGCQGCKDIPTPNIDSLAKNGVRCTSGYVSCPVCSPTRAGLMTGRYQQRFGHEFNGGPAQTASLNFGLPLSQQTIANWLKMLGYRTGLIGKWHLGYRPDLHPQKRGFDEFFGFLGGAHSYVDPLGDKYNPILRGTEPVEEKEYLTDALAREAVGFIERNRKDPFLLVVTFNAVHAPMQVPDKYRSRFAEIKDQTRQTMAGMLSAMDDGVGRILAKLRELNLEDDTLIFFISDNGGPTAVNSSRNSPLRGFKGQVWEGGVRVPFLVQWKGKLPAGKTYDEPVIALDILPTARAAAGANDPDIDVGLDGVNLLPYLQGKVERPPHDTLFWRYGGQWAVRQGSWKLVKVAKEEPQLFDLSKDIGEQNNLAAQKPELVKGMLAAYQKWDGEMKPPLWKDAAGVKKEKKNKKKLKPQGESASLGGLDRGAGFQSCRAIMADNAVRPTTYLGGFHERQACRRQARDARTDHAVLVQLRAPLDVGSRRPVPDF